MNTYPNIACLHKHFSTCQRRYGLALLLAVLALSFAGWRSSARGAAGSGQTSAGQTGARKQNALAVHATSGAYEAAFISSGAPTAPPTAEFHVNVTNDEADPGAMEGDGDLSLREAIILANAGGGPATIQLPAGTYLLTRTGSFEDNALTGDLDIRGNVAIAGAGAATTIIDAEGAAGLNDRIFQP